MGYKGVYIAQTCFRDGILQNLAIQSDTDADGLKFDKYSIILFPMSLASSFLFCNCVLFPETIFNCIINEIRFRKK